MIFMKLLSRSSRATGPKIRVPRGPLSSRMMTHAFSSNLMYVPSLRRTPLFVRTTTALTTSPFLTTPPGVAFLTVQTTMSPIFAVLRPEPPSTLIVRTSRAPELSATFIRLSCWIIEGTSSQAKFRSDDNRFFNDLYKAETLRSGKRAGFHDADDVACFCNIVFIMCFIFLRVFYTFADDGVLLVSLDNNRDRLVHFVGNDAACVNFALVTLTHACSLLLSVVGAEFALANDCLHARDRLAHLTNAS